MRLIETAKDLEELAPAWNDLAARTGSPMQSHAWAAAFAEVAPESLQLRSQRSITNDDQVR